MYSCYTWARTYQCDGIVFRPLLQQQNLKIACSLTLNHVEALTFLCECVQHMVFGAFYKIISKTKQNKIDLHNWLNNYMYPA